MRIKKIMMVFRYIGSFLGKNKTSIALSLGFGNILSFYIISAIRIKTLGHADITNSISLTLTRLGMADISFSPVEIIILLIGIVALLLAPLLYQNKSNNAYMIFVFISLLFVDIILLVQAVVRQRISLFFIILITLSSVLFIWLCGTALKVINDWVRTEDKKIDIVKLTLIWTTIMATWVLLK